MLIKEILVLFCFILLTNAVPKNGNNHGLRLIVNGHDITSPTTCASLAMISKSSISVTLAGVRFSKKNQKANVTIVTELYESQCEQLNEEDCDDVDFKSRARLVATNTEHLKNIDSSISPFNFQMGSTVYVVAKDQPTTPTKSDDNTPPTKDDGKNSSKDDENSSKDDKSSSKGDKNKKTRSTRDTTTPADDKTTPTLKTEGNQTTPGEETGPTNKSVEATPTNEAGAKTPIPYFNNLEPNNKSNWNTFTTNSSGIFVVLIHVSDTKENDNYTLTFNVEMRNKFGFISLVDYPALITFGLLLVVYIFYSFLWLLMMACHYKDIIRLQFWILAVILLGFTEKVFFVAEYGSANEGHSSSGLIYVAEGVSAGKRALARVLLVVVCEGFGTVRPRLGSTLTKVLVVGGIYFVAAFIDGITRASQVNTDGFDLTSLVTRVVVLFINIGVAYWIFSALVNTRRALRVRKNAVKLSLYNHLAYTLIATIIASLAFTVWELVTIAKGNCTSDWGEIWLGDCFWHVLFSFILLVIMIIWRPSANKLRFAYTQVSLESADEDDDQGANKNFENIKMRNVPKHDGPKPISMSQEAEDDLKWAEENLPTTLIDKTLPIVLDSEEEVMTTRFEASKMN